MEQGQSSSRQQSRDEADDDDTDEEDNHFEKVIGFFENADRQKSGLSLLGKIFGASNTKLQLGFEPK